MKKNANQKNRETANPIKARQIELLKKYYEIDEEKKLVKVKLAYQKASELFANDFSSKDYPEFNPEILSRVSQIIAHIPLGYKIDLQFAIKDYEGYEAKKLLESFNDAIEMSHYSTLSEGKKSGLQIALLLIAGIICLVLKNTGEGAGWFGEGSTKELISEIIDITGWVFVWEAVSIIFLSPSEERARAIRFRTRIESISFIERENNEILSNEKCDKIFEQWAEENKLKKLSREMLLVAGSAFIAIAISSLIANATVYFDPSNQYSPLYITLGIALSLVSFFTMSIAGIGAISRYLGHGPFQKFVGFFAVICLLVSITSIVFSFLGEANNGTNWKMFATGVFSLVFYVLYALGWALNSKKE